MKNLAYLSLALLSVIARADVEIDDGEQQLLPIEIVSFKSESDSPTKTICANETIVGCLKEQTLTGYRETHAAKDKAGKVRFKLVMGRDYSNQAYRQYSYITSRSEVFTHDQSSKASISAQSAEKMVRVLKTASPECPVTLYINRDDGALKKVKTTCDSML